MQRFDQENARRYWREHVTVRAAPRWEQDPEGLENVCHPGLPGWLNAFYAAMQSRLVDNMLSRLPRPAPGARALDVGCGAGRWCRRLQAAGYQVTGVDLQEKLIQRLQVRHPDMRFCCAALEDFVAPPATFNLVTCVTVLQHNPPQAQETMLRHMRRLSCRGAYALVLENVRDQGLHMFSHAPRAWARKFEAAGYRVLTHRPYDFSPALRAEARLAALVRLTHRVARAALGGHWLPNAWLRGARHGHIIAQRAAGDVDGLCEPLWERLGAQGRLPGAVHGAFLLQAV